MRFIIATLLVILAASVDASDNAGNYENLGIGTSSCASYVKYDKNKYELLRYTAWANGFTGFNCLTDNIDNITKWVDITARQEWLYKYCKKNTIDNFDTEVQKLIKELIDKKTTMCVMVNKFQAAIRQHNTAISLYFSGGDLICVHTLAGAAHNIIHDLVENKFPDKSWENIIAKDNNLKLGDFLRIARETQNFIKHAKTDPEDDITIKSDDTEHLLFLIVQNLCLLLKEKELLSIEASTFQLWFMATHDYELNESYLSDELKYIKNMNKKEQIKHGNQLLLGAKNSA